MIADFLESTVRVGDQSIDETFARAKLSVDVGSVDFNNVRSAQH